MKILSWEYANNSSSAGFALNGLEENQCVVFETSRKRQKLFNWRAQFLTPEDFRKSTLPVLLKSEIRPSRDSFAARRSSLRRTKRFCPSDGTESTEGPSFSPESGEQTPPCSTESSPENGDANPPKDSAWIESKRTESGGATNDDGH